MKIIWGSLIILLLQTSVHAADKVRIAVPSRGGQFITLPLAQKKGFFKEEGLDAEMIQIRGVVAMTALVSGEVDYFTGINFPIRAAIQGFPVKVVAWRQV